MVMGPAELWDIVHAGAVRGVNRSGLPGSTWPTDDPSLGEVTSSPRSSRWSRADPALRPGDNMEATGQPTSGPSRSTRAGSRRVRPSR